MTKQKQQFEEKMEAIRNYLRHNPQHGRIRIADALGFTPASVGRALREIHSIEKTAEPAEDSGDEKVVIKESGNDATAYSVDADIRTVEQLLKAANVNLDVWTVESSEVNKWGVVMREPATTIGGSADGGHPRIVTGDKGSQSTLWTRGSKTPVRVQLWQVKVKLKRKAPLILAGESLLKRIESAAPLWDIPSVRKRILPHRRAIELDIMDPHIGLLCQQPEADAPWDIDMSAATIMSAIDDLFQKADAFGPFEELFMPFGNDFTHVDNVFHTTTAGTAQPEAIAWHHVYEKAEQIAIAMVLRARQRAKKVYVYQIPGNHSRMADFTLARLLRAYFHTDPNVIVDASSSPYKFHRYGNTLIGFEHGHSVSPIRLAALMANERRQDWAETEFREWHLGDQHRKGSSNPAAFEEQGVSIEYIPGLTAPNEWHRLKAFNHQKRGAMAFVYDYTAGPICRLGHNISQYSHLHLK